MATLAVVISAYNEEAKIGECLESVRQLADEIIFVDNESTDKTVAIAKKYTSKIFTCPNNPMLNVNKNFGFGKTSDEWILSLDADERVTPELRAEIESGIMNQESGKINGYWIPRKNIIFGKWIKHTGWYPDHQLRLFKRGKGKFTEKHVHEMVSVSGKTSYLQNHIEHLNYETVSQFLQKLITIYTPNEAKVLLEEGYTFRWADVIRMPVREFLNRFFAQKGYKDGLHGLVLSLLMSFYHLVVFVKLWEEKGFRGVGEKNFLDKVEKESRKVLRDFRFWFLTARLQETKNVFDKLKLAVERKLR